MESYRGAAIGEHGVDTIGEDCLDQAQELAGREARVATRGPGEREVRMQVGKGNDKATAIIGLPCDAVESPRNATDRGRDLIQFGRAMKQLGIDMIPAYLPEARG